MAGNDNMNGSIEISCDGFDRDCVDIPSSKNVDEGKLSFSQLRSKARKESSIGKRLRKSLQTCKVRNNLAKLEGLLKCATSKSLSNILEGLLYILRQLLAQSESNGKAIGFLSFENAYGFYCGFIECTPDEANFRDHLLHKDHGLCVIVTEILGKRHILLQNEETSLEDFLLELERLAEENMNASVKHRLHLNSATLKSILNSLDTEYDRMALKAVLFTLHSRSETYNLGIKPDRAVRFISKVMSASDESEKALAEATDILQVRTQEKIKAVENKIQAIDHKLEKQSAMLSENRKCDIENEQNALKERLDHLKLLEVNDTVYAQRKTQQAKRKIARDIIDSKRIKKRKLGAGAPSLLDSEDEEFIANAISSKSTCHGRRHETTLFTNHRVKKRDFLSLANYSRLRRGKKLIKSTTTVTNRGKPRNVRSRVAKSHKRKWLWVYQKAT